MRRVLLGRLLFLQLSEREANEEIRPSRKTRPPNPHAGPAAPSSVGNPWPRLSLTATANAYTHVLIDEAELDYAALVRKGDS